MNQIVVKKTYELTVEEISQICYLFNEVFINHFMNENGYVERYSHTPLGYTIHALLKNENGVVIGSHNLTPYYYVFNGKKTIFAYGGGTMIKKEYRNFLTYERLIKLSLQYATNEGYSFLMGFPNDVSYPVQKKGLKRRDIGELTTYILPRKISAIKPRLWFLDFCSIAFYNLVLQLSKFSLKNETNEKLIHKDKQTFYKSRFYANKDKAGTYRFIDNERYKAVYRIMEYSGINTAFILDVQPFSCKNFDSAIRAMCKKERKSKIDAAMYVGHLPFTPMSLIKIPKKYEPKKFHFVGSILDTNLVDDRIFNISNWEVGLIDYDLL